MKTEKEYTYECWIKKDKLCARECIAYTSDVSHGATGRCAALSMLYAIWQCMDPMSESEFEKQKLRVK